MRGRDPIGTGSTPRPKPPTKRHGATAAEASLAAGGSRLGRYHIRGQQDFETVEIWRFPSAEAAFEHWSALTAAAYGEFNAFANNIGLAIEGSP